MKKIKLMISSIDLGYGGIETSLVNLLKRLNKDLYDITLVLEEKNGVFLDDVEKNIKILEYKPSKHKLINMFKRILWIIKCYSKYDVSICYGTYSLCANFVARISSKKKIFYVHSNYYELYNHDDIKMKEFFDCRYVNDYNKIIFVSNEARNDFIKIYPELSSKCLVINNIVDISTIKNLAKEKCDIKLKSKYIGVFIGRLDEESKRVSLIIDLARKCNKDIGFLIVGDGKDKKILENKAKSLDNVEFVGYQKNPYKYLNEANFLILVSKYEGYPVVYNEAIVLNKPILTTLNITDDNISINNNFGIVSSVDDLENNLNKIIKFKNINIDFEKINNIRIKMVDELIKELYEEK